MILLVREISNDKSLAPLQLIDAVVERNAYGRQYESFVDVGEFGANGSAEKLPMVFIRAPKFVSVGARAEVLGYCRGDAVVVRQGNVIATAFHPELTNSLRFQQYFLSLSQNPKAGKSQR